MPKLGLTMTEGMLAEWKVAPGDGVAVGDVLFVVETDKIANEIEATESGTINALLVEPGDVVAVGATVATFVTDQQGKAAPVIEQPSRVIATPLARRMASESGVDIASVAGSGPRGRIMADDISATLQAQPAPVQAISMNRGEVQPLGKSQKVAARRLAQATRDIPPPY